MADGALEVVGPHPARAHRVGAADHEPQLGAHSLARLRQRPRRELPFPRHELLAQRDLLLEVLGLPPGLQAIGELGGLAGAVGLLGADLPHRKQQEQESTMQDMKAAHVRPSRALRQACSTRRAAPLASRI